MIAPAAPNAYSPEWFAHFHVGIPAARTAQESAFVGRCCPLPAFGRLLDLCCGTGRHARALAAAGYSVTGVERDAAAVAAARAQGGGPTYLQADVRNFSPAPTSFDAAVILSQSFGYDDAETNAALLARLGQALRPGGHLVLDLWQPEFFASRQGQRTFETAAGPVAETTRVGGDRLFSRLDYPDEGGGYDEFSWQTFSSEQMAALARGAGLTLVTTCAGYDLGVPPCSSQPKVQFVLERAEETPRRGGSLARTDLP